jgi:hypothetical protein
MLNTFQFHGYPNVNQDHNVMNVQHSFVKKTKLFSLVNQLSLLVGYDPKWHIAWVYRKFSILKSYPIINRKSILYSVEGLNELILAPQELEYSNSIKKSFQFYLGLSIYEKRVDNLIDEAFENSFVNLIKDCRIKKQKILYCAFGSYFHGKHQHKLIAGFCLTLISALYNLTGIRIILSINQTIIDSLRKVINKPENFYYYTRVNQIQVLNEVDLFITHGGLGSIKEGINYSVPMVVYPVDKQWDQVGNGAKVEFHKIGLKGDIINDEPLTVRKTILRVLNDISYKENIIKMKQTIDENYNIDLLKEKIYTSLNIFTDENK